MADSSHETDQISLPTLPDDIGVVLPAANLRRLDFSALDFQLARRSIVEYVQTYYPAIFNNWTAANGAVMFFEVIAGETAKLSLRGDLLYNEAFEPLCTTERALTNHLALIGQRIRRQTPATTNIQVTVDTAIVTDIEIAPGTKFSLIGPDQKPVFYELYRAPGDFTSPITIPAGKRGVIGFGIEGSFVNPFTVVSSGGASQIVTVDDPAILEDPIIVMVATGSSVAEWTVVTDPLELYGPNDTVVEVTFFGDTTTFTFGDDLHGKSLLSGQVISISYRAGGGSRGRIGANEINENRQVTPLPPANAPTTVTFVNITPSIGGEDKESLEAAKKRGPRDFATHNSIVTDTDYAQLATSYSHPVFGTVAKGVAALRTSRNANQVELYILATGSDGRLTTPSLGLKEGLKTFIDDLNVLTDEVLVFDGGLYTVDVNMTVVMSRNADVTVVKNNVEAAISRFFDPANWEMGQPLYISNLIGIVKAVDGVDYVDLFQPQDNILPKAQIDPTVPGVAFNELIVEGQRSVSYYYSDGKFQDLRSTLVQP